MAQEIGVAETAVRFTVGRVIAQSISVFLRYPLVFIGLAVTIGIPDGLFGIWYGHWVTQAPQEAANLVQALWAIVAVTSAVMLVGIATFSLTEAAFTIGIFEDFRGRPVHFLQCLRGSVPALRRLLALSLLLGCAVGAGIALTVLTVMNSIGYGVFVLGGLFGLAGIVLIVNWWVIVPAIVVEGITPFASFGRSYVLTTGHRWGILALVLLPGVVRAAVMLVLGKTVGETGAIFQVVDLCFGIFYTLASALLSAVSYYYLRAEKEGFSVEDIAAVFD